MSVRALTAVWECSKSKGADLLVMLALADWADFDGWCWPGLSQLQRKTRLSRPTVIAALKQLVSDGELSLSADRHTEALNQARARALGYQPTAIYRIEVGKQLNYLDSEQVVKSSATGSQIDGAQVVKSADPSLLVQPSVDPSDQTVSAPALPGMAPLLPDDLRRLWNEHRGSLPECRILTPKLREDARARLREQPAREVWIQVAQKMAASKVCAGSRWATFRHFVKRETWAKALEGAYDWDPADRREAPRGRSTPKDMRRQIRDANVAHVASQPIYKPPMDDDDDSDEAEA